MPTTVDQSVDIWSLGCIYSVVATWVIHGWEAVDEYVEMRRRAIEAELGITDNDCFHDGRRVLPQIRKHHKSIGKDVRGGDKISAKVVNELSNKMLVERNARPTGRQLTVWSDQIIEPAKEKMSTKRNSQLKQPRSPSSDSVESETSTGTDITTPSTRPRKRPKAAGHSSGSTSKDGPKRHSSTNKSRHESPSNRPRKKRSNLSISLKMESSSSESVDTVEVTYSKNPAGRLQRPSINKGREDLHKSPSGRKRKSHSLSKAMKRETSSSESDDQAELNYSKELSGKPRRAFTDRPPPSAHVFQDPGPHVARKALPQSDSKVPQAQHDNLASTYPKAQPEVRPKGSAEPPYPQHMTGNPITPKRDWLPPNMVNQSDIVASPELSPWMQMHNMTLAQSPVALPYAQQQSQAPSFQSLGPKGRVMTVSRE